MSISKYWRLDARDSQFEKVWEDIRDHYIPAIIRQKPDKILPKEQWAAITGARYIRIDFNAIWPSNVISWLAEAKPSDTKGFEGIKSIIAPSLMLMRPLILLLYTMRIESISIENIKKEFLRNVTIQAWQMN